MRNIGLFVAVGQTFDSRKGEIYIYLLYFDLCDDVGEVLNHTSVPIAVLHVKCGQIHMCENTNLIQLQ